MVGLIGSVLRCRAGKEGSRWVNQTSSTEGTEGSPASSPSLRSNPTKNGTNDFRKEDEKNDKEKTSQDVVKEGAKDNGMNGVPKGVSPLPGVLPAHHKVRNYLTNIDCYILTCVMSRYVNNIH